MKANTEKKWKLTQEERTAYMMAQREQGNGKEVNKGETLTGKSVQKLFQELLNRIIVIISFLGSPWELLKLYMRLFSWP